MGGQQHSEPPPLLSELGESNIRANAQDDWRSTQVQNGSGVSEVNFGQDPHFGELPLENTDHHDWKRTKIG
jgi:hypothetical protein